MRSMYDAAFPPAAPPNVDAVAGYIGGNTPHVWSDDEWARQKARYRLPIFTRSHDGDPAKDANASVAWAAKHNMPKGTTIALDFETRVDARYLQAFDTIVVKAGWKVMVYGSRSTLFKNPKPSGGYWDAQWTNEPHLNPGSAATQYGSDTTLGQPYDLSMVADSTPLWEGAPMTDAEWKKLENLLDTYMRKGVRYIDHGDENVAGAGNNLKHVREDLAAIKAVVDRLVPSNVLDLSQVSDDALVAELNRRLAA